MLKVLMFFTTGLQSNRDTVKELSANLQCLLTRPCECPKNAAGSYVFIVSKFKSKSGINLVQDID